MTTARTHETQVGQTQALGRHQARIAAPRPDDFAPVGVDADGVLTTNTPAAPFEAYDPSEYTSEEVKAYVEDHPDEADAILELELDGKDRSGLTSWLENFDPSAEG